MNNQTIIDVMKNFTFSYGLHGNDGGKEIAQNQKHYTINDNGEVVILPPAQPGSYVNISLENKTGMSTLPIRFAEYANLVEFHLAETSLVSLKGLPKIINGCLWSYRLPGLSLADGPEVVSRYCHFDNCGLDTLENLPTNSGVYFLENNDISSFNGLVTNYSQPHIDIRRNRFSNFDSCPQNVKVLDISLQKVPVESCQGIPEDVEEITIDINTPLLTIVKTKANMTNKVKFVEIEKEMPGADKAKELLQLLQKFKDNDLAAIDMVIALRRSVYKKLARY